MRVPEHNGLRMRHALVLPFFLFSTLPVFCGGGCSDDSSPPPDGEDAGPADSGADAAADAGEEMPERVCRAGGSWSPGSEAFVDRTEDWGLDGLTIRTFTVADVDGDGWQDVVTTTAAYAQDVGGVWLNREVGGRRVLQLDTDHPNPFPTRDDPAVGRYISTMTAGDVDNDGDVDLFVDEMDYPPADTEIISDGPDIYLNDGAGVFELTAEPEIVGPNRPLTVGSFFFDQDLDGSLDLAIGYWWKQPPFTVPFGQQPQLFRGDGAGGFEEVTDDVGMTLGLSDPSFFSGTNVRPLFSIAMCDIENDGRMEILGAAYGRMYNELFVADGETFEEDALSRGVAADDRLDYTTDDSYRCYCLHHVDDAYCDGAEAPEIRGICTGFGGTEGRGWSPGWSDLPVNLGGNTFTQVCEDFDNDGDFDIYESNIKHPDTGTASDPSELLVNDGTGHFERPGREAMGLEPPMDLSRIDEGGQQAAAWDFDNDGRLDILLAGSPYPQNRGWFFHQQADGSLQFEWIGEEAGFYHACPSGMALADFDHDGDQDVIVGTYGCNDVRNQPDWTPPENQPTRFYENVSNEANWTSIRLVGLGGAGHANRTGLGARVTVTAAGVTQTRLVHGTWGQGGMSKDEVAFFGLGETCDIDRIEVRWPNGSMSTETFADVRANYRIELHEGDPRPHYLP